jgi:hypothetical protein
MALNGNLSGFSFVQLLNLINLAKKTGALTVKNEGRTAKLYFRDGKIASASLQNGHVPLVKMLAGVKLIPASLAAQLTEKYKNNSEKEAGIFLMNSGLLSQTQIFSGIEAYLKEIVRTLFFWREGDFNFSDRELPPSDIILVNLDLENLIIEGSRSLSEFEDLAKEIPSLDMSLKFSARPGVDIQKINLNASEWRVVSLVNSQRTMKEIAQTARLDEIGIRRIVYNLLQAGLVEIIRPISVPLSDGPRIAPPANTAEQRSLIHRVINRIKSL